MINPKLIITPFANDGQRDEIPVTRDPSMPTQKATWDLGFPPITMLPESAGGLPPRGRDFNGLFNQISEMLVHIAKGGRIKFSDSYAAAIGGYSKGAILQSDDEARDYQSLIDANGVNFNTATQAQVSAAWKLIGTASLATDITGKLDKNAITQTTGNSTTSVMSQKAVTEALNTKQATGSYATVNQLNAGLLTKQPTGDYLLKNELPRNTASKQINGWHKDADTGLITQWGYAADVADDQRRTYKFPIQFQKRCFGIVASINCNSPLTETHSASAYGFVIDGESFSISVASTASTEWNNTNIKGVYWFARGE